MKRKTNSPSNISRDKRVPLFPARLIWGVLGVMLILSSPACTTVKVSSKPQRVTREGIESARHLRQISIESHSVEDDKPFAGFSTETVALLKRAQKLSSLGEHDDAAGHFLEVAIDAQKPLLSLIEPGGSPAQKALLTVHNRALARFAEFWADDPRRQGPAPYLFHFDNRTYEITLAADSDYGRDYFDQAVASRSLRGKGVVQKIRAGYGASMVGIREQLPERAEELKFHPSRGLYVPVTLVMEEPRPGRSKEAPTIVPLAIKNPMLHETVTIGGHTVPMAADFSAPLELLLDGNNQLLESLAGFFEAEKRISSSGIFMLEPYDPDRIPVILVHGLVSVPMIWRNLIPELLAEPEISRRYQFMMFTYPSSYSVAESALLFRENLAALRSHYDPEGQDPLSTDVIAIGHSMGGMLSHVLTADFGDRLWNQLSDVPLEETRFSPKAKAKLRDLLYFDPDPAINRAIFIAAPHRGAKKAMAGIPNLLSRLVKLPTDLLTSTAVLLLEPARKDLKIPFTKKMTSIQSLRPDSPIALALDASPYRKGVVYHSIIGDRGRGDTPDSSDGVVEYWSSHQEGAASEIIVPTHHSGSYKHPMTIAEIQRILRLHVGLN